MSETATQVAVNVAYFVGTLVVLETISRVRPVDRIRSKFARKTI